MWNRRKLFKCVEIKHFIITMNGNNVKAAEEKRPLLPRSGAKAFDEDGEFCCFLYLNYILAQHK